MSGANIIAAGPAHAAIMAALHATGFAPGWSVDALRRLLAVPGTFAGIAQVDDQPAGFILCRAIAGECEILTLSVVPARRRAGVGRALVDHAVTAGRARGAAATFLEVAADNSAARALYAAAGFVKVGTRPGYYARDSGPAVDADLWCCRAPA